MVSTTSEQPIARYRPSMWSGLLMVGSGGGIFASADPGWAWLSWLGLVMFVIGAIDMAINAWRAPVILYPSRIVTTTSFLAPTQEVRFEELLGWGHTKSLVGFESAASGRAFYSLASLRQVDRGRLVAQLRSLLGDAGRSIALSQDLERREDRIRKLQVGAKVFVVATFLILFLLLGWAWFAIRHAQQPADAGATPPAETPREPLPPRAV